jgi:hypothetical protein
LILLLVSRILKNVLSNLGINVPLFGWLELLPQCRPWLTISIASSSKTGEFDPTIMTNPDTMAVPPSNSPGLIRLRLPSQASTNSAPPPRPPPESSPQLVSLEQSLRQLIQSLLEAAITIHDLEEGTGELLFQKMYSCAVE